MELSFWESESFFHNPDVAIIGSGIVGLTSALFLKQLNPQINITILERGIIPQGASTRNAGFACYGSLGELVDDLKNQNSNEIFDLVEKRFRGLQQLRQLIGDDLIDYEGCGSHELFFPYEEEYFKECCEKIDFFNAGLKKIIPGGDVFKESDDIIKSFGFNKVIHAISNQGEGALNPGKMMRNLLRKVNSLGVLVISGASINNVSEESTSSQISLSDGIVLRPKFTLITTNGFANNLLPDLDVTPARSQVFVTEPINDLKFNGTFHLERGYVYFRKIANRLLLGGGRHINIPGEATDKFGLTRDIQEYLEDILSSVILPECKVKIEQRWSGIMGVSKDKSPIIKMHSDHIGVAVRMGGMGIAIGTLVGEKAARMIIDAF